MSVALQAAPNLITAEEALRVQRAGPWELIRGRVVELMPGGGQHGAITSRLIIRLGGFIEAHGLGETFTSETGVLLERGPDTVRAPDFAFTCDARADAEPPEGWVTTIPDLIVEVASPGDRRSSVDHKVQSWLNAGVRLVWEVSPARREIVVHHPEREPRVLSATDSVDGEDVVPGFCMLVGALFSRRRGREAGSN